MIITIIAKIMFHKCLYDNDNAITEEPQHNRAVYCSVMSTKSVHEQVIKLQQVFSYFSLAVWVFKRICRISPIPMGLSVSVCVSVSACFTIVRAGHTLAKIKKKLKIKIVDFDICHRMVSLQKLFTVTLIYYLNFKNFKYWYPWNSKS